MYEETVHKFDMLRIKPWIFLPLFYNLFEFRKEVNSLFNLQIIHKTSNVIE